MPYGDGTYTDKEGKLVGVNEPGKIVNSASVRPGSIKPSHSDRGKATTIAGFRRHIAEKLCKYVFREYFVGIQKDVKASEWKVYLREYIMSEDGKEKYIFDKESIEDFVKFWGYSDGSGWRILLLSEQQVDVVSK